MVEFLGISKAFISGGSRVVANDGVSFSARAGSIHAIVGENGAGKSTAMKMLFGMFAPDSGEILLSGKRVSWRNPTEAMNHGIGMVHQHFMLAGPYTVLENIVLGQEKTWLMGPIDFSSAAERLNSLVQRYSMPVDLYAPVENLSVGVQQRVEILKLLYRDSKVLILDEPTAVLTPQETDALFQNLRRLRDEGRTILIITHKLKEVLALSDEVTVLRQGRSVGTRKTSDATVESLAEWMVGRKVVLQVSNEQESVPGKVFFQARELFCDNERYRLKGVSCSVRSGEIVGIAGVEGNGQSALLRCILDPSNKQVLKSGFVEILGNDVTSWSPEKIRSLPLGFVPEDRHRDGMLLDETVETNFLLGLQNHPQFVSRNIFGFRGINQKSIEKAIQVAWEEYDLRPRRLGILGKTLSGGNQQKLVIAREFQHHPKFLVIAHPTRGVDVGAQEWIHHRILSARNSGAGVLLVSSELDEILALSDRILVMFDGAIVAEFKRGAVTLLDLGLAMSGSHPSLGGTP